MSRGVLVLSLLSVMGCAATTTEIVVISETNLSVPEELDAIRIVATDADGLVQEVRADLGAGAPRPVSVGLVSETAPRLALEVVAIGELRGVEVLRRTARVMFIEGRVVVLRLDLFAHCVEARCGAELTCAEGGCRSIDVAPSELPSWTGSLLDPPMPLFDASAPEDAGLDAMDAGLDGGDLDAGFDAAFDVGRLDAGWDAGLDAGRLDGGRDAGRDAPIDTGIDTGRPDTGVDAGVDVGRIDAFVPECTLSSECGDGLSCTTDACTLGRCVNTPSDAACDDGMGCTSETCDESLGCVYVTDDAACGDGVGCTLDACDRLSGCVHTPVHTACSAGQYCDVALDCTLAPDFDAIYTDIISVECTPCHTELPVSGTLDMTSVAAAYASLIDVPAACGAGANTRVIPRDPRTSLLWRKVAGVDLCGARMPRLRTPLLPSQIDAIEQWIAGGAVP